MMAAINFNVVSWNKFGLYIVTIELEMYVYVHV